MNILIWTFLVTSVGAHSAPSKGLMDRYEARADYVRRASSCYFFYSRGGTGSEKQVAFFCDGKSISDIQITAGLSAAEKSIASTQLRYGHFVTFAMSVLHAGGLRFKHCSNDKLDGALMCIYERP